MCKKRLREHTVDILASEFYYRYTMGLLDSLFGKKQTAADPTPSETPYRKILVVEDDKDLRDFYCELLVSEGYTVSSAENGQLGLDAVIAQKPDLVLLDLMMPVMDGKTMLHNMRQQNGLKYTPVIVLTNAGDADSIRQTKTFDNANEFLIKANITPDVLLQKIRTLI